MKGGGVQLATATVSTAVYTCGTTHCGIGIYPTVLTRNRGYGVVHGCGVGGCGCGMPPDHPRCHLCYTLTTFNCPPSTWQDTDQAIYSNLAPDHPDHAHHHWWLGTYSARLNRTSGTTSRDSNYNPRTLIDWQMALGRCRGSGWLFYMARWCRSQLSGEWERGRLPVQYV